MQIAAYEKSKCMLGEAGEEELHRFMDLQDDGVLCRTPRSDDTRAYISIPKASESAPFRAHYANRNHFCTRARVPPLNCHHYGPLS